LGPPDSPAIGISRLDQFVRFCTAHRSRLTGVTNRQGETTVTRLYLNSSVMKGNKCTFIYI